MVGLGCPVVMPRLCSRQNQPVSSHIIYLVLIAARIVDVHLLYCGAQGAKPLYHALCSAEVPVPGK